jgi:ABC-type branched-subunit amino acid transport system substrate-binding protein
VSEQAKSPELFSQGERILLHSTPDKEVASVSFAQKDWQKAIADFTPTATPQTNDPEAKIYLYNAQARQLGNPLTVAVVVPLKSDPNGSKEILRGVAKFQEEFWQTQPGRALEIVIVNDLGGEKSREIAADLEASGGVLGILGHGIDPASQQAIRLYMEAGIPILSPLTTSITNGASPQLKIISLDDKTNELLGNYLKSVGTTLAQYAKQVKSSPKAVVFYNSNSPYSEQLKKNFVQALSDIQGKVIQEIDTKSSDFNASKAVADAQSQGANTMLLAMSKAPEHITQAIALAQANNKAGSPLLLLGGNELYNPDILVKGGDNIKGLILAVPWSFQANDSFSQDAIKSWKGRVSWRTATAYDALKTLTNALQKSPERQGANQTLQKGIPLTGSSQNFNLFDQVPLVKAVGGNAGPPGSKYQFETLP